MTDLEKNIILMEKRIEDLEQNLERNKQIYINPGLNNESFLRRAFTIFGHNIVAGLILSIPFYLIMFIFGILLSRATVPF